MKRLILIAALALVGATACFAPGVARADAPLRQTPLGFCSLASLSASTGLSACTGGIPAGSNYLVICAYTSGVVWRDDGPSPTTTPGVGGQGLSAGSCLPYSGTLSGLLFIQQGSGAILGVTFYK